MLFIEEVGKALTDTVVPFFSQCRDSHPRSIFSVSLVRFRPGIQYTRCTLLLISQKLVFHSKIRDGGITAPA